MTFMTALQVKLLDWASSFLDENDREAVLGDVAEEGVGCLASVMAICGLIFRKEVERWRSVSPWVVLVLLLLPCTLLLIVVMNALTDVSSIYLWMFINNADFDLLRQSGYWFNVRACMPLLLWSALALAGWSWCAGFVIGSACRKVRMSNLVVMVLLFGFAVLGWMPLSIYTVIPFQARNFIGNAAVFRNVFYRDVFPWMVLLLLVVMPALRGMNDVRYSGRGREQLFWIAATSLILFSLVTRVFVPGPYSVLFSYCGVAGVVLHFCMRAQNHMPGRLQTL